jgi:hypothetical protein
MTAAEDETTGRGRELPTPVVGDQHHPANAGNLGYTYTIYRFYDRDDRLLYLGRSDRIRQRIVDLEVGHPRGLPLGHEDGPKPWWREAATVELQHLPPGTTDAEARAEERRQIEAFHPVYNREHNETFFDRERMEQAIDAAHFEVDVATAEHVRHDGVVRPLDQIALDAERAANRFRPDGAGRLRQGRRRPVIAVDGPGPASPGSGRAGVGPGPAGGDQDRLGWSGVLSGTGPGSIAGLTIVLAILVVVVVLAVMISFQAVY